MKPELVPPAQALPDSRGINLYHADPSFAALLGRTTPDLNPSFRQFCAGIKAKAEQSAARPTS